MRVLTWNINGVRTLPQYHPYNTFKTFDEILQHLEADIICFQEMKTSRKLLQRPVALPPSFDSFFSIPIHKSGYSGVATYTRKHGPCCVPLKAEEGLTGLLQPKPPLAHDERVSSGSEAYPPPPLHEAGGGLGGEEDQEEIDYKLLDSEGRSLTLDFGLFVLINTYCPNSDSSESRASFKKQYHALLSARIHTLIHEDKREVVLVGDLNACAAVIDHVEGELMVAKALLQEKELVGEGLEGDGAGAGAGEEGDLFFAGESRKGRRWLRDLLIPDGDDAQSDENMKRRRKGEAEMIDITRKFWPGRKGMYTCWNTKISARATNYGTRIDYILITPGLLPWIKHADTQPHIKGSDHCPVYVDFHDEIEVEGGRKVRLEDVLGARAGSVPAGALGNAKGSAEVEEVPPPRIAARFWEEFSGRQTSLQQFFGAGAKKKEKDDTANSSTSSAPTPTPTPIAATPAPNTAVPTPTPPPSTVESDLDGTPTRTPKEFIPGASSADVMGGEVVSIAPVSAVPKASASTSTKRKLTAPEPVASSSSSKKVKTGKVEKKGQQSIASFFGKPAQGKSGSSSKSASSSTSKSSSKSAKNGGSTPKTPKEDEVVDVDVGMDVDLAAERDGSSEVDLDEDYKLALQLSQQQDDGSPFVSSQTTKGKDGNSSSKDAWTTLLAPTPAPRCRVHNEVAKEFTVNKPGVNKGKRFFICSRPIGPGYDMGKSERPREQVDPQYKCDFFKWSSDVRKEMMAASSTGKGKKGKQ